MTEHLEINKHDDRRTASEHAIDERLRAIRLRFLESILPRLLQFEDLKQMFTSNPDDPRPLSEIGAMAHKIAGVAETLGFEDIGRLSGRIDGEIAEGVNAGDPPVIIWRRVETTLEAMLEKMEAMPDA